MNATEPSYASKRVEIRADLDAKIEAHCLRQKITRKQYLNTLIERDLDDRVRREHLSAEAQNKRGIERFETVEKTLRAIHADLPRVVDTMLKVIPTVVAREADRIIEELASTSLLARLETLVEGMQDRQTSLHDETRQAVTAAVITAVHQEVQPRKDQAKRFEEKLSEWDAKLDSGRRFRKASFAGGAALPILGLATLMLVLPATAPSRWMAIRLMGGQTPQDAAMRLAGDGIAYNGALMAETATLLRDASFAREYGGCIDRAKQAAGRAATVACRLTMQTLVERP